MTVLEKYEVVNQCETVDDLIAAIYKCAEDGMIIGRHREFLALKMANYVEDVILHNMTPDLLTRSWGIRQQALYIKYYFDIEKTIKESLKN